MQWELITNKDGIVKLESTADIMGSIKGALSAQWITSDLLAVKILKLLEARGVTNSGIEFDDNKTILETIKLVLKLGGVKGIGDGPQIAIFNNAPGKDDKLSF